MKKERKARQTRSVFRYAATRVIVFGVVVWLLFSALFTEILASQYIHFMEERARNFQDAAMYGFSKSTTVPGQQLACAESELCFELYLSSRAHRVHPLMLSHDFLPDTGRITTDFDENGIIRRGFSQGESRQIFEEVAYVLTANDYTITSRSHMSFPYVSEENWLSGDAAIESYAVVYLDVPYRYTAHAEYHSTKGYGRFLWGDQKSADDTLLRLTGYFDSGFWTENEFHPVSIDAADCSKVSSNLISSLSQADRQGDLVWENLATFDIPTDGETLQTIYAGAISSGNHMYEPFSISGKDFTDLVALIQKHGREVYGGASFRSGTIFETVIMTQGAVKDCTGTVAIRFWPLQYVLHHAWYIYPIIFLLTALCVFFILRKIRQDLTLPLEDMTREYKCLPAEKHKSIFPEVIMLGQQIQDTDQKIAEANTEIQRLNTALDYAKDAEENRRQLVSNLTHDLKTPIAVIHSYAEGLQAGIAKEKQDRYLSVIMEESEHLDAMVLQMLDLSRLEAGKVRLASDRFSLLSALRNITDRFAPMLEAKNITLIYTRAEDFIVTADEARIGHALTNLVENALKYCPANGEIRIALTQFSDPKPMAHFTIENPSAHLPKEALEKVWGNFYRTDPSRKEPGTGLGLAIVKSIIGLHGGTCTVRNTTKVINRQYETGVEFGFTLPLQ